MRHPGDDVGAHLARTDQADADRTARLRPRLHVPRQSRQCNIRSHNALLRGLYSVFEAVQITTTEY